jgi:type II secretion system protein G
MKVGNLKNIRAKGFTLIELLVIIIILGFLLALVAVAYNGTQADARDSRRQNDIAEITKGLELFYLVNHRYPTSGGATSTTNTWSTTADSSWNAFVTALAPHMDNNVPKDPTSTPNANIMTPNGYNYAYFSNDSTATCGALTVGINQMYMLVYRLENSSQINTINGNCATTVLNPVSNLSNYRMTRI